MKGFLKANMMTTESSYPIFLMFSDHVRDDESNHLSTVGSSKSSIFFGENEISNARQDFLRSCYSLDKLITECATFRKLLKTGHRISVWAHSGVPGETPNISRGKWRAF